MQTLSFRWQLKSQFILLSLVGVCQPKYVVQESIRDLGRIYTQKLWLTHSGFFFSGIHPSISSSCGSSNTVLWFFWPDKFSFSIRVLAALTAVCLQVEHHNNRETHLLLIHFYKFQYFSRIDLLLFILQYLHIVYIWYLCKFYSCCLQENHSVWTSLCHTATETKFLSLESQKLKTNSFLLNHRNFIKIQ